MKMTSNHILPMQPFMVLETESYQQRIFDKDGIAQFYQFGITDRQEIRKVPDGCVDVIFRYGKEGVQCFATATVLVCEDNVWDGPAEIFGVRFMPGIQPKILKVNMQQVMQVQVALSKVLKDSSIESKMSDQHFFEDRVNTFMEYYESIAEEQRKPFGKEELVDSIRKLACHSGGKMKIYEMSKKTGYSERYLNKVFSEAMGVSPKTFCKIIQFQCAVDYLNHHVTEKMTDVAVQLGYYDQPQFIRDFKSYAGITPKRFLHMIQQERYKERMHCPFRMIV